jgi:hypothetical protein
MARWMASVSYGHAVAIFELVKRRARGVSSGQTRPPFCHAWSTEDAIAAVQRSIARGTPLGGKRSTEWSLFIVSQAFARAGKRLK